MKCQSFFSELEFLGPSSPMADGTGSTADGIEIKVVDSMEGSLSRAIDSNELRLKQRKGTHLRSNPRYVYSQIIGDQETTITSPRTSNPKSTATSSSSPSPQNNIIPVAEASQTHHGKSLTLSKDSESPIIVLISLSLLLISRRPPQRRLLQLPTGFVS